MTRRKSLLLAVALVASVNAQCYFPSGSNAPLFEACDEFASNSLCCPYGWTCFSGRLCVITRPDVIKDELPLGSVSRGACTNSEWEEGACGELCLDSGRAGQLTDCGENRYCCAADEINGDCDCSSGRGTFYKELGNPEIIIGFPDVNPTAAPPRTSRRSTTTRTQPTTSATSRTARITGTSSPSPSASSASIRRTGSQTATAEDSATSSSASTAISEEIQSTGGVTTTPAFKAGVAVGGSALLIILFLLLFLCARSYHRRDNGDGGGGDGDSITSQHIEPKTAAAAITSSPYRTLYPNHDDHDDTHPRDQAAMLNFRDRLDFSITAAHPPRGQQQSRPGALRWASAPLPGADPHHTPPHHPSAAAGLAGALAPKRSRRRAPRPARRSFPQSRYSALRPVSEVSEPESKPNTPIPFDGDEAPSPVSPISPSAGARFTVPRRPLPGGAYHALGLGPGPGPGPRTAMGRGGVPPRATL